ncbi:hypothetical protein AG1IA_05276 [Rhizoctonia solani AG-1 IA]|uniref:Uncharacterized protein n=1 Tax=Thanatephorus cucumeris (strain AG1-IA) TaxID=983506 RepID=L8WRR7_THACA|nr:hypothetical protein AG1IA_05276 [Rhizoctonia solani AG-1 IA]
MICAEFGGRAGLKGGGGGTVSVRRWVRFDTGERLTLPAFKLSSEANNIPIWKVATLVDEHPAHGKQMKWSLVCKNESI